MLSFITKQHKLIFAAGAAVGVAVIGVLKTKKARDLAVKSVAGGIMLKDKALETVANIKEEADDIVCEAKTAAQQCCIDTEKCECEDKCACE